MQRALLVMLLVSLLAPAALADIGLRPQRQYCGVNRAIPVTVDVPTGTTVVEIELIDPVADAVLARRAAREGSVDVAQLFPVLWTSRSEPRVLLAQCVADGRRIGAPLVLTPMLPPRRATDGLTNEVVTAFERRDAAYLKRLQDLPDRTRRELRERVIIDEPALVPLSGMRVTMLRNVILETEYGEIEIAVLPWIAPRTSQRFVELAAGGLYEQVAFHRVVASDPQGRPFIIQAGDPTGTGAGGMGAWIDFEPSTLEHSFGVVSLARRADDPNSNSSQFMICLSRGGCAKLDGLYTSFGRVIRGADVVLGISAVPVGPSDEDDPMSPIDRPLEPVVIETARSVSTPPWGMQLQPVTRPVLRR
ncbi:MAG: peptidylprolyl isomerase [Planctomycetota bacterium]